MICMENDREVRFVCGHCVCCRSCLADIRADAQRSADLVARLERQWNAERAQHPFASEPQGLEAARERSVALCPQCREPIGAKLADEGESLRSAPTFQMAPRHDARTVVAPAVAAPGRTGAPGRGGRGGRGRGAPRDAIMPVQR